MEALRFEHSEYLWALVAIPVCLVFYRLYAYWRLRTIRRIGDEALVRKMIAGLPRFKNQLKTILMSAAFLFLILSAANPQLGQGKQELKRTGIEVMIALDVSKSMMAEDMKPNRLERARQFILKLIDKSANDRIGLIVFAGNAYLQMPMTIDHAAARIFLRTIHTDMIPTQGTAIAEAISRAREAFSEKEKKYKALIIISDGEDHEEGVLDAVEEATKEGITIFTVGVGTAKGAPIPELRGDVRTGFKADNEGNIVLSKLNEEMLGQIAILGNGEYFNLTGTNEQINTLTKALNNLEQKELELVAFDNYISYFQVPLSLAVILLLLDILVSNRRNKSFSNWKIFEA